MEQMLYELILNISEGNDESSKLLLLKKFDKTIKHYAKKLNYYCAETDLIIFMLTLINNLDLKRFVSFDENTACKYINSSIKYEYIRLSKKNSYINSHEMLIDTDSIDYTDNYENDFSKENSEFVKYMAENLTGNKRKVFVYLLSGYSITEISKLIGISRQAVNKIKKKIEMKFADEYKRK